MSRSNPHANAPNPAVRWFEWNGELGTIRYYDKETKKNVDVALPFTFLLLDELASVRGWHEPSKSGIYSNEVRDTTKDVLLVKAYKGGTLAEGLYRSIKEQVTSKAVGGQYVANLYIAVKLDGALSIGSLRFKGSGLGSWMEFRKLHRSDIYEHAVRLTGYTEDKKGRIVFRMPTFEMLSVTMDTHAQALALDKTLQDYLKGYLQRKTRDQEDGIDVEQAEYREHPITDLDVDPLTDADIPF